MFAKMSFLILLLFTLPLLSFAQESSMFYLAPDYDFRKVPDSGGKPVTVRSQCNISYLTAKPSTFGPHGCWRSWRPGPAGTWGASWTSTKLLKLSAWTPPSGSSGGIPRWDNQVHVEESNLLLKFVPKLSQSCLKVVPKLSQRGPKVVPKLQASNLLLQVRGTPQQDDSDHVTITPRSSNSKLDITKVLQNQNVVLSLNVFLSKKKLWMPDFFFDQAKKVRGHPSGVLPAASVRFKLIRIFCKGDQFWSEFFHWGPILHCLTTGSIATALFVMPPERTLISLATSTSSRCTISWLYNFDFSVNNCPQVPLRHARLRGNHPLLCLHHQQLQPQGSQERKSKRSDCDKYFLSPVWRWIEHAQPSDQAGHVLAGQHRVRRQLQHAGVQQHSAGSQNSHQIDKVANSSKM